MEALKITRENPSNYNFWFIFFIYYNPGHKLVTTELLEFSKYTRKLSMDYLYLPVPASKLYSVQLQVSPLKLTMTYQGG